MFYGAQESDSVPQIEIVCKVTFLAPCVTVVIPSMEIDHIRKLPFPSNSAKDALMILDRRAIANTYDHTVVVIQTKATS